MFKLSEKQKNEIVYKSTICKKLQNNIKQQFMQNNDSDISLTKYFPIPILEFVNELTCDGLTTANVTGAFGGDCIFANCNNTRPRHNQDNKYEALMVIINAEIASHLEVSVEESTFSQDQTLLSGLEGINLLKSWCGKFC